MSKKHLSAKLKYDKRYVYILALILLKDIARKEIIVNDNFLTELTCKTIKKKYEQSWTGESVREFTVINFYFTKKI